MAKAFYSKLLSIASALSFSVAATGCQTGSGTPIFKRRDVTERPMKVQTTSMRESGRSAGGRNY